MHELPGKMSQLNESFAPPAIADAAAAPARTAETHPENTDAPAVLPQTPDPDNDDHQAPSAEGTVQESQDGQKPSSPDTPGITDTTDASATAKELDNEDERIRIDTIDLKKVIKNKTILLDRISLSIPAGSLVAVVGSSGTGKSTLMNAMNGSHQAQQGKVLYNGHDLYRNAAFFREQLGYVPQDDIVHPGLTVEHALYYAAKMRLPAHCTKKQIQERIDDVLRSVGLTERRELLIGRLSGGQRKRVSIAMELLDKPEVFFLDEPTSGLDPGLDFKMMRLLRDLSHKGQTIVVSTHATSNITICDYICFLAPGGQLAYFGPPKEALAFFQKETFAQVYPTLDATSDNPAIPTQAAQRFRESQDYRRYVGEPVAEIQDAKKRARRRRSLQQPDKRCNCWVQFWLLSRRYLELLRHDIGNVLLLLLQAPVIALLLVALMKYETGTTMFTQQSITKCPTNATVFTANGLPNIPTRDSTAYSNSCSRVQDALNKDVQGKAYAKMRGGTIKALQDFIVQGSGSGAQKILFIMSFTAVLFGCVNAVREIVKEDPIYRRERAVHLGIIPYMFSKLIVLGVLCMLQDAILLLVVNLVAPFAPGGTVLPMLPELYVTLVLTSLSGLMIGLAISGVAPSTDRAMSIIPLILIPQVIFSGTVFPFKGWVTQIIAMLFTARWSIGALGSSVGLHNDTLGGDNLIGKQSIYNGLLFSTYTHAEATTHLLWLWGALGAMVILSGIIVCFFLKLKDWQRQ